PPRRPPLPYATLFRSLRLAVPFPGGHAFLQQSLALPLEDWVPLETEREVDREPLGDLEHRGRAEGRIPPNVDRDVGPCRPRTTEDRKSTRLNSSHQII